jgi:hypothetical protein
MTVDAQRAALRATLISYTDPITRSRKAYFENQSFAFADKHDREFRIKSDVCEYFKVPFRSVVFTGSAQLGFSPHKDTPFQAGKSDLDIACVSSDLYVQYWEDILRTTRAFTDQTSFVGRNHFESLKEHILRRGMILIDFMPNSALKKAATDFLDTIGRQHRDVFNRVTFAIYLNEYAFCSKQTSALNLVLDRRDAE